MTTRPIAIALLTTLIAGLPEAAAERKRKRRIAEEEIQTNKDETEDQDGFEATAVLPIKLDDLVEVAVRLAPELARSKNDRITARGEARAARKNQQWGITLTGQMERFATSPDVEVGAFQTVAENKLTASIGVARNLPTGGSVGFEIGIVRIVRELEIPAGLASSLNVMVPAEVDQGASITDTYGLVQSQAKMTLTQPLARKFGRDVALAQETKGDLAATDATVKTQLVAEEMLRDIVIGYWELAYAAYEVDTRAEALELARKQEEQTRIEIRAKLAPDNALSSVLFEISTREEALLTAKSQWEKKSLELRKKVGLELSRRDLVMRPKDPFEAAPDEWDVKDVLRRARKSNRRLASLILQKRIADVDVKVAKNAMLPAVDLNLSGALVGTGNTADAAFGGAANANGFQVMAGVSVNFEIGGAAKGQHDAARARRQRIEVDQADVSRALDVDVVHSVNQVKSARARVALAEKAITLGEENVKSERSNYNTQRGGATTYTIMQRQTELINARLRKGRAIADYHLAVAQVQFHGGMLLEQYRVNVRPLPRR